MNEEMLFLWVTRHLLLLGDCCRVCDNLFQIGSDVKGILIHIIFLNTDSKVYHNSIYTAYKRDFCLAIKSPDFRDIHSD